MTFDGARHLVRFDQDGGGLADFEIGLTEDARPRYLGYGARSAYCFAKLLTGQLEQGHGCGKLRPAMGIHMLNFIMFPKKTQSSYHFCMRDWTRFFEHAQGLADDLAAWLGGRQVADQADHPEPRTRPTGSG